MAESVFKENLFDGKKVFITGGATGMGLGFAQAFLNHGAKVFVASRKEGKLEEAASASDAVVEVKSVDNEQAHTSTSRSYNAL